MTEDPMNCAVADKIELPIKDHAIIEDNCDWACAIASIGLSDKRIKLENYSLKISGIADPELSLEAFSGD